MPGTNVLAYYGKALLTTVKSFITSAPGGKTFFIVNDWPINLYMSMSCTKALNLDFLAKSNTQTSINYVMSMACKGFMACLEVYSQNFLRIT